MRIIVDADACPELQVIADIALENKIECHLFCDHNHNLDIEYATTHYISAGFQMVDIAISNFIDKEDILITQDYGLACVALGIGSKAINPNGIIYTSQNIDTLIEQKYLRQKCRKQNIKVKNMKKRTDDIRIKFISNLKILINFTKNS